MTICSPVCSLSIHAEGNLIPGALAEGLIMDTLPQEARFTPTAPREGGQSPDLCLLTNREETHILPGEGQGLNLLPGKG